MSMTEKKFSDDERKLFWGQSCLMVGMTRIDDHKTSEVLRCTWCGGVSIVLAINYCAWSKDILTTTVSPTTIPTMSE